MWTWSAGVRGCGARECLGCQVPAGVGRALCLAVLCISTCACRLHSSRPQDALAEGDKITLEVARLIKDDYLQQNSYTK